MNSCYSAACFLEEFIHVILNRGKADRVPSGILERPDKECSKKLSHNFPSTCKIWGSLQKETWELRLRNSNSKVWVIKTPYKGKSQGGVTGSGLGEGSGRAGTLGANWRPSGAKCLKSSPYWFSHSCYILGKEGYTRMQYFISQ